MTPQQIVGIGVRLFAIWLAVACLHYFLRVPAMLETMHIADKTNTAYGIAAGYAIAALLLWLFPMWAAHKLLPRTNFENHLNLQPLETARVGCALMGLWFFAHGFLDAVWFFFRALLVTGGQSTWAGLGPDARLDAAVIAVNVIFGLVLIFRAETFAAFVGKLGADTKGN